MKVLLIDDEASHRTLYRYSLQQRNHQVIVCEDASEGLEKFSKNLTYNGLTKNYESAFDVVLVDVMLPDTSGVEIAKEILVTVPNQKIVFISAYVKELLLDSLKEFRQPVQILEKPFTIEKLTDAVEDTQNCRQIEDMSQNLY